MKLRYLNTRADILRGNLYAVTHNRALLWYLGALLAVVTGLSIRDYLARGLGPVAVVIAILIQLVLYAVLMAGGLSLVTLLTLYFHKGRGVLGEHELELTEAGLIERTDVNESLHKWPGVGRVGETASLYLIRVNESGGALHLVPKAGRILEGDPTAFIARLKAMKESTSAQP